MIFFTHIFCWMFWLTVIQGSAILLRNESGEDLELSAQNPARTSIIAFYKQPIRVHRSQFHFSNTSLFSQRSEVVEDLTDNILEAKFNAPSPTTVTIDQTVLDIGTLNILPTLHGLTPHTTGILATNLEKFPKATIGPLLTKPIPIPTSLLSLGPLPGFTNNPQATSRAMASQDIFEEPIDTKAPPSNINVRADHPVARKGISSKGPLQTNKFYSNFFLGDQRGPTYTFPYAVSWAGGQGPGRSWGISCSHTDANQRVFGPTKFNNSAAYYINPVGIQSMIISAKELGNDTTLTMDSLTAFSARVNLSASGSSAPVISFPLVQGMAFVTAEYSGAIPLVQTGVFFKSMTRITQGPKDNIEKYVFTLENGSTWRLYGWKSKGDDLDLTVVNNGRAESKNPFYGILQIARDPMTGTSEKILDDAAGIYPVTVNLTGSVSENTGSYSFRYSKAGHQEGDLYMYALPHILDSFSNETKSRVEELELQTTTKGMASLVKGTEWTMHEQLPCGIGFAPWHPEKGSIEKLSDHAREIVRSAAAKELSQNVIEQSNLDSMYFSGKALAKFATICYVVDRMIEDHDLAQKGLSQLKAAFGIFAANKQKFPLVHETAWGGVVSSATYVTGSDGADFGNTYYNDHHFHYGYHILAAAIIGHLDSKWLEENRDYVNMLVRDVANPSLKDEYYPMWRSFDWYHGHSWAHGLYASLDGKDQESSSEDIMHAYALKMWGEVNGDANLEARGTLQLAIIARSLKLYYLYETDNTIQPKQFIGNKVAGILFENKVDHATYFSPDIEAIQGIHMIPILPPTPFARCARFVEEEWDAFFSDGRVDKINNAWKGIIYASYATIEPKKAWEFFSSKSFDPQLIDGGASLTWFLAYAAALGNI